AFSLCFFFQAEDGIRYRTVTGVQTCALPILAFVVGSIVALPALKLSVEYLILLTLAISFVIIGVFTTFPELGGTYGLIGLPKARSEERRVGKEWRAPMEQDAV